MQRVCFGGPGSRLLVGIITSTYLLVATAASDIQNLPGGATHGGAQPEMLRTAPKMMSGATINVPQVTTAPASDNGQKVDVVDFKITGMQKNSDISKEAINNILSRAMAKNPEGFTVTALHNTANEITQYYRQAGYILAQAIVPQQTVADGIITIQIIEGKLGRVISEGNERYSSLLLAKPFAKLIGKSVRQNSIETAVLKLGDYPGLKVKAVFVKGEEIGAADLIIKVIEEDAISGTATADNHGTQFTGEWRGRMDVSFNNIMGHADVLSISALSSFSPRNSTYGGFNYQRPLKSGDVLGFSYSKNRFKVGNDFSILDLRGDTKIGQISLRRDYLRSRRKNAHAKLDFSWKRAETDQFGALIKKENLSVLAAEMNYDFLGTFDTALHQVKVRLSHGFNNLFGAMGIDNRTTRRGGSGAYAAGKFNKVTLNYARLQPLKNRQSLLFRFDAQFTRDMLTTMEQFSIGGPNSVRAYSTSERLADVGAFISLAYQFSPFWAASKPAFSGRTWGEVLQFSLYADLGSGRIIDPLVNQNKRFSLKGLGASATLQLPGTFYARLDMAGLQGHSTYGKPANGRETQYFLTLNRQF